MAGRCRLVLVVVSSKTKQEDIHFRILRLLEENPMFTQRELADTVGISLGSLNYCLKALLDRGQIKVRNFRTSDRKLSYAYLLTPSGIARKAELTTQFLKRKIQEYRQLKAEIESLQRGATSVGDTDVRLVLPPKKRKNAAI